MDDREARLDLPIGKARVRHQGAVFGVDIGPGEPEHACAFRHVHGAGGGAAVRRAYGDGRALPVTFDVAGGRRTDANLFDQPVDDRISDLYLCRAALAAASASAW